MKFKIILLITLFAFASCKDEKKEVSKENNNISLQNEDYFTFSINAVIENDDEFTLFYLDVENEQIAKEKSISLQVSGSLSPQDLVFKLKEDVLPTRLILRFGNSEKTQKIDFNESRLNYYGKEIVISKENFFQFFIPNNFINFDREAHTAVGREVDSNYDPTFFSREILENKINYTFF